MGRRSKGLHYETNLGYNVKIDTKYNNLFIKFIHAYSDISFNFLLTLYTTLSFKKLDQIFWVLIFLTFISGTSKGSTYICGSIYTRIYRVT